MITASNLDKIVQELEEYSKEVERKLKNTVAGFAREVALAASTNTPVGSEDMLIENSKYRSYYLDRQSDHGIPIEPGYHSGAWQYTEGSPVFTPVIFTSQEMQDDVFNEAESSYQLGDTFSIAAIGPGYASLESGSSRQAPEGIVAPTLSQIQAAHEAKLKQYYEAG